MNVGIIGAGAIATYVLKALQTNEEYGLTVTSLLVRDREKYESFEKKYNVKLYTNVQEFLKSPIDIVVEAANILAVEQMIPEILEQKDVVLISVGALANETFLQQIKDVAEKYERQIHLPSGAIGGLDLVQNASNGEVQAVTLETRKPAHTLVNEPITEEQVIFTGFASEAIEKYPKNMNVSIALALAGIGFDKTKVKIIADPHVENNIHQIEIIGEFGHATFTVTNNPLQENPNTSHLAAVSVIGTLQRLTSNIKISS